MEHYKKYVGIVFISLLAFVLIFNNLSKSNLHDWDESIYAENALEMIHGSGMIIPTYAHMPDMALGKPPLGIWLEAVSFLIFGVNLFALRFFSAFFALATVVLTYLFGKKISGTSGGIAASTLLLTNPALMGYDIANSWPHGARTGDLDTMLTFLISASLYAFFLYQEKKQFRYLALSSISTGCAFMLKSVLGLIPIAVIIPILFYNRFAHKSMTMKMRDYFYSVLIFLAITLPWTIACSITNPALFRNLISYHIIKRTFEPIEGHTGTFFYYFVYIFNNIGILQSILLILSVVYCVWLVIKRKEIAPFILLCWLMLYLAAFTLVQTKLFWYIFPAYPAITLLIGKGLSDFKSWLGSMTLRSFFYSSR
jgi:4-amino-4-deoxy-L-arabinose transferase-like glycosyltransferase